MKPTFKILRGIVLCLIIIGAGVAAMNAMAKMKKMPEEKSIEEKALPVEVIRARPESVRINLTGYGEVAPLNTVDIAPEISGMVQQIHPRLETGEIIPKGEVLFKIDADDHQTAFKSYARRYQVLQINMDLAKKEYLRVKKLYEKSRTGTQKDVETAESEWNTARDNMAQMEKLLEDTRKNLDRCTVRAPFTARIKAVSLEAGQYVSAGTSLMTLADDSLLEMTVPVDTSQALLALDFKGKSGKEAPISWFGKLENTRCQVIWSEAGQEISTEGTLHRVVSYDAATRMVTLAVRIRQAEKETGFPIVDGMFCQVVIPGKTLENIIRVPEHAVSYDGRVRISTQERLKTVPVHVIWKEEGYALISGGLAKGDRIITSRLDAPLENTLLDVSETVMIASTPERQP